jgi:hypothetical protein
MNFISYEAAYSIYPQATFEDFTAILFSRERDCDRAVWDKYTRRGWTMLKDNDITFSSTEFFSIGCHREVCDLLTWRLPLPFENLGLGTVPILALNRYWKLRFRDKGTGLFIDSPKCVVTNYIPSPLLELHYS